jgi:hypothetical protein
MRLAFQRLPESLSLGQWQVRELPNDAAESVSDDRSWPLLSGSARTEAS